MCLFCNKSKELKNTIYNWDISNYSIDMKEFLIEFCEPSLHLEWHEFKEFLECKCARWNLKKKYLKRQLLMLDNINYYDESGRTLLMNLMVSPIRNKIAIIKILVKCGADIKLKSKLGTPILFLLVNNHGLYSENNFVKISKLLISLGADVNDKNIEGLMVIEKIINIGFSYKTLYELLEILIENGAEFDKQKMMDICENEDKKFIINKIKTKNKYSALFGRVNNIENQIINLRKKLGYE